MKIRLHSILIIVFLCISSLSFSSHIVGGSLSYIHNGGSSYTITLKLFRDCSPGKAGFDPSVTITVLGYNGAPFAPTKNISMSLGTVTLIPPTLPPCAIAPNPIPCVQQGIYTKTVTNLPPNPGGYHLFWQREARNVGLSNCDVDINNCGCLLGSCLLCVGSSFDADIPGETVSWAEDFKLPNNTTVDNGTSAWGITLGNPAPAAASIQNNVFRVAGANNGKITWTSQIIPITSCSSVNLKVDFSQTGILLPQDSIMVYYRLNGGPLTLFPVNGLKTGSFTPFSASKSGISGSSIQIIIRVHFALASTSSKVYFFDNVLVSCNNFIPNSNPVFNLFPPIFLCVGEPFTFDHSATDANGDSLVYSFYTPFNGENAMGPLDPTFSGNNSIFTPIVWLPGYSATNPLGGAPLSLNASTGLLSGTPGTIGKFIVGIKVKDYRNGIFLSQTMRDFQFNVVNCPPPPPPIAGTDIIVNQGCSSQIAALGYNPSTVTWNSIYPGAPGAYNSYLSCTSGCMNPTVTGQSGAPPYVDFQICGVSSACLPANACDIVRVNFNFTLSASISPQNPSICSGQTSTTITANGSGGSPPYNYLWNNINPSQSIVVGNGTYTVKISDGSGCPPAYSTITVSSYSIAISADAGQDKTVCKQTPITTLNGSVDGASGGIWSGGAGIFSPNNTTLSGASYSPSSAELTAGFVVLTLTTTGNGDCLPVSDSVRINYESFSGLVSFTQNPVSCSGGSDGSATATIAGGTPPFSYSWNTAPAQTGTTANNLSLGTYNITITNGMGCTSINPVTITQQLPVSLASIITNVSCNGENNGAVSITASGGTNPYNYLWSNGSTISQITNLSAQTYSLTVSDSKNCQTTSTYAISEPSSISIQLTPTPVNCFNGNNGVANSIVTGGTPPYSYNWSTGATSPNAFGLQAGTFTLSVTDLYGCSTSGSLSITEPAEIITSISTSNVTCNYLDNGSATAISSGGNPSYTYLWQPGSQTSSALSNLSDGTYTLTTTDSLGCSITTFATIAELSPISINFISTINVSCFGGSDGAVTANPVGGSPNYSYLWVPGGFTTSTVSNLFAGAYTVTVTDSKGCTATDSITITQPLNLLTVSASSLPTTCFGGNNGSVSASATNGIAPYTYFWMPASIAGQNISNLEAGTYTVTASDSKGCMDTSSITVNQPAQIVLNTTTVNSDCGQANGQTAVSITSGGNPPFSYLWSPTGGTDAVAPGLISGAYNVTVTDFDGCTAVQFGNVSENAAPVSTIYSVTNVSCYGGSDGSAKVATVGGIAPFTFSWQPSGGADSIATGLTAGSYTVTVTGANNCKSLATINPGITEPLPILISLTKTPVSCFGGDDGTASAIASGGTPGYAYLWSNGGTASQIANLSSQTYTIQVTDTNSCLQTMPVLINEPSQLELVISSATNVSCKDFNDGTATATVSGGTAVYYYNWMPSGGNGLTGTGLSAGTYTLTVSDFNGCIKQDSVAITQPGVALSAIASGFSTSCFGGSNGTASISTIGGTPAYFYLWNPPVSTNDTASGLSPGNYLILVTDTKGCQTNLAVDITEPAEISGSLIPINPSCGLNNGSISSQLSGGVLPYTYLWSLGGETSSTLNGLGIGTYNLLVTDASNCSKSLSATLVNLPDPAIAVSSINNVSCFGGNDGAATLTITQGTAPYTINWMPSGGNGLTASALAADTYTLNVTDASGCLVTDSLMIGEPSPVDVNITSLTDVLCNGGSTGSITVAATGGTGAPYTYSWLPSGSSSSTANNLAIGSYTVIVSDQNNCTKAISASITEPSLLSVAIDTIIHATCYGGFGSASLSASGGVLPYSYSWSAPAIGQTGSEANNLIAGTYTVTITDTTGCFTTAAILIKEPLEVITATGDNDTLCLGQSGSISASAMGGEGNYYYAWQPSGAITSGTLPITPTSNTTYTVVAYDQLGCPGSPETITAIVYDLNAANVQALGTSPICPGQSSAIYVETSGTTGPLSYQWDHNLGNGTGIYLVTPTQPTTYIVTVTNMCGLSVADSINVEFNPPPVMALTSASNELCVPGYMPFYDNSVTGNTDDPITSWEWNFGDGNTSTEEDPEHNYEQPGAYQVTLTVTTSSGCTNNSSSAPIAITAHPIPTAAFSVNSTNLDLPYDVLILNNESAGANSYVWEFGDGGSSTQFNPEYLFTSVGTFQVQLIAMSQYGCVDTAFAEITTNADVIFPNVFTPNPNGSQGGTYDINNLSNDIFFPYSSGVIEFKIEIFNRWGEEIFESLDIKLGWDGYYRGAICQQDVYVWKAYIKLNNGKIINKSGDVTLLRF